MRYDFSPFYRSTVGFDRLFDMLGQNPRVDPSWPPYDIEKMGEDAYRITMAVAGFAAGEIDIVQQESTLLITGQKQMEQKGGTEVLHHGIATRSFRQTFNLADHVKVINASLDNGLLTVDLKREVPEALKPRRIAVGSGGTAASGQQNVQRLEARAA